MEHYGRLGVAEIAVKAEINADNHSAVAESVKADLVRTGVFLNGFNIPSQILSALDCALTEVNVSVEDVFAAYLRGKVAVDLLKVEHTGAFAVFVNKIFCCCGCGVGEGCGDVIPACSVIVVCKNAVKLPDGVSDCFNKQLLVAGTEHTEADSEGAETLKNLVDNGLCLNAPDVLFGFKAVVEIKLRGAVARNNDERRNLFFGCRGNRNAG